jgi:hypothetical protein
LLVGDDVDGIESCEGLGCPLEARGVTIDEYAVGDAGKNCCVE